MHSRPFCVVTELDILLIRLFPITTSMTQWGISLLHIHMKATVGYKVALK